MSKLRWNAPIPQPHMLYVPVLWEDQRLRWNRHPANLVPFDLSPLPNVQSVGQDEEAATWRRPL